MSAGYLLPPAYIVPSAKDPGAAATGIATQQSPGTGADDQEAQAGVGGRSLADGTFATRSGYY